MRRALLASLAVALLIAPSASAQGRSQRREIKEWFVRKSPAFQEQSWSVYDPNSWKASEQEAIDDALQEAQRKVTGFLLDQDPPVRWMPPISFIKRELVKDMPEEKDKVFNDQKGELEEIAINGHRAYQEIRELHGPNNLPKTAHRVCLKIGITPEAWGKILEEQRNDLVRQRNSVMKERMLFLLKIMGGLVALMATVAGYIRLDEWSRGYYTNWLRLAALTCVGIVALAGWRLFLAN
jgi:hypothetical protein